MKKLTILIIVFLSIFLCGCFSPKMGVIQPTVNTSLKVDRSTITTTIIVSCSTIKGIEAKSKIKIRDVSLIKIDKVYLPNQLEFTWIWAGVSFVSLILNGLFIYGWLKNKIKSKEY